MKKYIVSLSILSLLLVFQNCSPKGFQAVNNSSYENNEQNTPKSKKTPTIRIKSAFINQGSAHFYLHTEGELQQIEFSFENSNSNTGTKKLLINNENYYQINNLETNTDYTYQLHAIQNDQVVYSTNKLVLTQSSTEQVNPEIINTLNTMGPNSLAYTPDMKIVLYPLDNETLMEKANRESTWSDTRGWNVDYSRSWMYVENRNAAFYNGGNHGAHRKVDVWGYYLLSNTMVQHSPAIGGDHYKYKNILLFDIPKMDLSKYPIGIPQDKISILEELKDWWKKNIIYKNDVITTSNGGPLVPSHNWDTFVYDPRTDDLLFPYYRKGGTSQVHEWVNGPNPDTQDGSYPTKPCMFTFSLKSMTWNCIQHEGEGIKRYGSSTFYMKDSNRLIGYQANHTYYNMQEWKPDTKQWITFQPNNGKISNLVKQDLAPDGYVDGKEPQCEYSPKSKIALCLVKDSAYIYDAVKNEFSKWGTYSKINSTAANTSLFYDSQNEVFVAIEPKQQPKFKNTETCEFEKDSDGNTVYWSGRRYPHISIFDINTKTFSQANIDCPQKYRFQTSTGHYDPINNVIVMKHGMKSLLYRYK